MTSGVYERKPNEVVGKIKTPKYIHSHKAILEILNVKRSTVEVTKELFEKYRIIYCVRTVREHIADMVGLGWIKKEVGHSDMRVPYYQKTGEI